MSETFSVGQQLTLEGFLAIILRCLQSTKYKMDKWNHVNSCYDTFDILKEQAAASRGHKKPVRGGNP